MVFRTQNIFSIWYILGAVCLLTSCRKEIRTKEEFNTWLNNTDHKCIVSRVINGVNISIKYLPPSYLALKDISKGESQTKWDSLLQKYNTMVTFLMTIGPDKSLEKEKQMSVMDEGVENYHDYVERVLATNFFIDQHIQLYIDDSSYSPVLALVENAYELSGSRNFIVAFSMIKTDNLTNGKSYVFVYKDPFFSMGNVQFNFSGNNLYAARNLNIAWSTK